ncbi:Rv3235 family protein [Actinomyces bowdenii]|uniref:Rv3235 family protein n=1 Tax=Actinomyces bowdenii TaxID=131109 RepID=UPI001FBB4C17|nr:Rv3235 family protein [Actinomyces bowdenii]
MTTTTMTAPAGRRTGCSATASASPARQPAAAGGHPARRAHPRPSSPAPSHPGSSPATAPTVEESSEAVTGSAGRAVEPELLLGPGTGAGRRGRDQIDLSQSPGPAGGRAPSTTGAGAPGRPPSRGRAAQMGLAGREEPSRPPHPARSAAVIVVAAAEVLAGQRPADHLARWTTPAMFEAIARRAGLATRVLGSRPRSHRPRMRSVHTQLTVSGACEATILLEDSGRVRAAAARLIIQRGRWILAGLEIA